MLTNFSFPRLLAIFAFSFCVIAQDGDAFDQKTLLRVVGTTHGVLAVVSWVVLAPITVVLLRTLPGSKAVWAHGMLQVATFFIFATAAGLGIWLARTTNKLIGYHTIIGLILFGISSSQFLSGLIAHTNYKEGKQTIVGFGHALNGIFLIMLGMINGGLGLPYGKDAVSGSEVIAYAVIVSVIWLCFISFITILRIKKAKARKNEGMSGGNGASNTGMSSEEALDMEALRANRLKQNRNSAPARLGGNWI